MYLISIVVFCGGFLVSVQYKDYYKVLGVERNATKDVISKAYKKLAKQYHPDLNPGNTNAEDTFKDITEAYEVLKDDEKRKMYDQLGSNWQDGQQFQGAPGFENFNFNFGSDAFGASGFSDFFDSIFGGSRDAAGGRFSQYSSRPQRGRDIEAEFSISLEDSLHGGEKSVTLQTSDGPKTLKINIPQGIRDGSKLRLSGQGYGSPNNGPKGDLYLRIKFLPHANFHVEGNNLTYNVKIMPWEAVLGTKVHVPTLEGTVELSIPEGTNSGRKMRLKGKGLGSPGSRGDLFVVIGITVPTNLTDKQRNLWEALASDIDTVA